ncbi:hypothetical protein ACRTC8_22125, partial [Vibrio cholerae]|uniref:hypothetical protein n=1 Tax=Vibrio cholerae TaxID=666 RepID=UPI003D7C95A5
GQGYSKYGAALSWCSLLTLAAAAKFCLVVLFIRHSHDEEAEADINKKAALKAAFVKSGKAITLADFCTLSQPLLL